MVLLLNAPILPSVAALTASSPAGVIGCDVLHRVGTFLFGSALHDHQDFGVRFIQASSRPRLAAHYYGLC
jgi:hypothetical protein